MRPLVLMTYLPMFVAYGSPEYQQAVQLRYRLFYQEHGIEMGLVLTAREQNAKHLVVLKPDSLIVLAYGQLYRKSDSQYQIFQMVVEPDYQGQGLGSVILEKLIEVATYEKGELLALSASNCIRRVLRKVWLQNKRRGVSLIIYRHTPCENGKRVYLTPSRDTCNLAHIKLKVTIYKGFKIRFLTSTYKIAVYLIVFRQRASAGNCLNLKRLSVDAITFPNSWSASD